MGEKKPSYYNVVTCSVTSYEYVHAGLLAVVGLTTIPLPV